MTATLIAAACCSSCGRKLLPKRRDDSHADLCRRCWVKTPEGRAFRVRQQQGRRRMNADDDMNHGAACGEHCVHWHARCTLGFTDPGVGGRFAAVCPAFMLRAGASLPVVDVQLTLSTTSAQPLPGA